MADGKVVIDVILEDGRVVKGVANVNKSLDGMTGSAKSAAKRIGEIAAALGLVGLARKAIDMVKRSIDGAISRYDTLNNFPRVMEQIGFSADDSRKAIDRLSDGIQGLPTTLDDVASTAQRIAVMTGDLDGAVETTLALNNAFISSGSDAANASRGLEQYVQMLSKGEVDLQSWRTLQETMGVALNDVAKAFGYAGASAQNDLYDALKEGEITFDQFNKKLIELSNETGGFADRALTASGGIRTAWTNMGTAIVRGVTNIITAIDEFLADTPLKSIENIITNIGKVFFDVLDSMANNIGPFLESIVRLYNILKPLIPIIAGAVAGLVGFKIATFLVPHVKALAGAIMLLRNPLFLVQYGFLALNAAIRANPIGFIVGLLVGLITTITVLWKTNERFREIVLSVWGSVKSAIESMKPVLETVIGYFSRLHDSVQPFLSSLATGTVNAFNSAMEWLANSVQVVSDFFGRFKESLGIDGTLSSLMGSLQTISSILLGLLGPIGWIIKAIGFLATETSFFTDMVKFFKGEMEFSEVLNNVTEMSVGFIENMSEMLVKGIEMGTEIIVNLIEGISKYLPKFIEMGTEIIVGLIDTMLGILPTLIEVGTQALTTLIEGIVLALPMIIQAVLGIVTTLITAFVQFLPMIIEVGITLITTLVESFVTMLPMLVEIAVTLILTLVGAIIEMLPMLIETGITLITTLLDALIENLPLIIDAGIQLLMALIEGLIEVLPALIDAVIQIIMALLQAIIDSLPKIIEAGIQILLALIDGIIQVLPELVKAALQLIVALVDALIRALPQIIAAGIEIVWALIKGIASLLWELVKAGGELVMSLIEGIGKFFSKIFDSGKDLAEKALEGILNIRQKFKDAGKNIVESIADGITGAVGTVTGAIGNVASKIRNFLPFSPAKEGALRDIMDVQIAQSIAEAINKGRNSAIRAMASLTDDLNAEIDGAVNPNIPIGFTNRLRNVKNPTNNVVPQFASGAISVGSMNRAQSIQNPSIKIEAGDVIMDGHKVGSIVWKPVKENIEFDDNRRRDFRG